MKMGILDFLQENNPFLNSREGDFIPLNNNNSDNDDGDSIGPPLLILYAAPSTIGIEEYRDMVCDGMPNRRVVDNVVVEKGDKEQVIVIRRLDGMNDESDDDNDGDDDAVLDLTVKDALDTLASSAAITTSTSFNKSIEASSPVAQQKNEEEEKNNNTACPVLYFSGVTNSEMMTTYRIIANEIYQETNGVHWPACAKVVRPALVKSLRQVLCEISSDHADAMRLQRDDEG